MLTIAGLVITVVLLLTDAEDVDVFVVVVVDDDAKADATMLVVGGGSMGVDWMQSQAEQILARLAHVALRVRTPQV